MTSDDLLEYSNTGPSLSFPVLWVRVQSLQHIKRFSSVVELTHLWREKEKKKRKKSNDFLKQIKKVWRRHNHLEISKNPRRISYTFAPIKVWWIKFVQPGSLLQLISSLKVSLCFLFCLFRLFFFFRPVKLKSYLKVKHLQPVGYWC